MAAVVRSRVRPSCVECLFVLKFGETVDDDASGVVARRTCHSVSCVYAMRTRYILCAFACVCRSGDVCYPAADAHNCFPYVDADAVTKDCDICAHKCVRMSTSQDMFDQEKRSQLFRLSSRSLISVYVCGFVLSHMAA